MIYDRCSAKQSGELGSSSEAVDGIIGFGQANTSILSQLASSGKVKKVFSHCLDGNEGGGIFAIGEVVQPKVNRTPLVPNEYAMFTCNSTYCAYSFKSLLSVSCSYISVTYLRGSQNAPFTCQNDTNFAIV